MTSTRRPDPFGPECIFCALPVQSESGSRFSACDWRSKTSASTIAMPISDCSGTARANFTTFFRYA
jgi:hypothetical protein